MTSIQQLTAMGFSQESAKTALAMNSGNFDNALGMLLSQAAHAEVSLIATSYRIAMAVCAA